jgi:hypothetical protein
MKQATVHNHTRILVVGCSMTAGYGLTATVADPFKIDTTDFNLWVNQLCNQVFDAPQITNLAVTGKNNQWIFIETACALTKVHYDVVIVAWSAIGRLNYNLGLETYPTNTMLPSLGAIDININPCVVIPAEWQSKIGDQIRKFSNDHWALLDLIKYVNILKLIQIESRKSKLFFVNTLFDIPTGYFDCTPFTKPSSLPKYTQDLLQVETRNDDEIEKLYNMIHTHYRMYGGINSNLWLNLYKSFWSMTIDQANPNDRHPGYKSQKIFSDYLTPILTNKLNETMHHSY